MLKTQYIATVTQRPVDEPGYHTINVLKWKDSKWKSLCPYYLKTDGREAHINPGGILFENFWQGSKYFAHIIPQEQYPSRFQQGNPKYLQFQHSLTGVNSPEKYEQWRRLIWACAHPIRHPNGYRSQPEYAVMGTQRLGYIEARKAIYFQEYCRLIRALPAYQQLLGLLKAGQNLMICEMDVPNKGKKGGFDIDSATSPALTLDYLNTLLDDPSEPFGHGLCLAHALLTDKMVYN